jgi:acyl carrier protein
MAMSMTDDPRNGDPTNGDPTDCVALLRDVRVVAGDVLGDAARTVDPDADLVATLGVDSLTGLRVLAAMEKRFGVRFADDELASLRSFEEIAAAIIDERMGRDAKGAEPCESD